MTALAFLDIETTSLERPSSPTPGEVWEVGLIVRPVAGAQCTYRWLLPVTLEHADPVSLDIGRFHERHPQGDRYLGPSGHLARLDSFAVELEEIIPKGAHLVGNVVSFDEERLDAILHAHGIASPPWHYHLVDVEALAAGYLRGMHDVVVEYPIPAGNSNSYGADILRFAQHAQPRWDSEVLGAALGVEQPSDGDRHTALGDARWAMATYDAVMGTKEASPA